MSRIRATITLLFLACFLATTGSWWPSYASESKGKPADTAQQTGKPAEHPSHAKQAHKALKSMDTKIPAETSKAVRSTKEFFKKRFRTTHEGSTDRK